MERDMFSYPVCCWVTEDNNCLETKCITVTSAQTRWISIDYVNTNDNGVQNRWDDIKHLSNFVDFHQDSYEPSKILTAWANMRVYKFSWDISQGCNEYISFGIGVFDSRVWSTIWYLKVPFACLTLRSVVFMMFFVYNGHLHLADILFYDSLSADL